MVAGVFFAGGCTLFAGSMHTFAKDGVRREFWAARFCNVPHSANIWLTPVAQSFMEVSPELNRAMQCAKQMIAGFNTNVQAGFARTS